MSDGKLQEAARDRAGMRGCELVVEERDSGWFAAFVQREEAFDEPVVLESSEVIGGDRRLALLSLLRNDDLTAR